MAASASWGKISVRVLVNEKKNKVIYVAAGHEFVDVLLTFLTLPLGTIVRLVSTESNMRKVRFGSLSSLYESVANIEGKHFWTDTCVEMLLQPRNPMENYCQYLKLNIDDTERTKYFACEDPRCSRCPGILILSAFRNKICKCRKPMNRELSAPSSSPNEGFVSESASFIITDDLMIMPETFQISCLPINHGFEDFDGVKEVTLDVTRKEMVNILKCSLQSTTPLTDVLLQKKQFIENAVPKSIFDFDTVGVDADGVCEMMKIKVLVRKSDKSILFALSGFNFVDFILSFLTFPLGRVEHMLKGNTGLSSIDNVYKSILDLDCGRYLTSTDLRDMLVRTPLAPQFKIRNNLFPMDEVRTSFNYYCKSDGDEGYAKTDYLTALKYNEDPSMSRYRIPNLLLRYVEPQSASDELYSSCGGRGFVKDSVYMVTNDFVVIPTSSFSVINFLTKSNIPPTDLEERVVDIGKEEGLGLLRASLNSSATLTNALSPFLKFLKEEKLP